MSRRIPIILILLVAASQLAVTASIAASTSAKARVLVHKTSPKGLGRVDVISSMPLHHKFRLEVSGHKHSKIQVTGYENYTYVLNKRLGEGTVRLALKGSIPRNFLLKPPMSKGLVGWYLGVVISTADHQKLTVKLVDAGKS